MLAECSGIRTVVGRSGILRLVAVGWWLTAALCLAQEPTTGEGLPGQVAESAEKPSGAGAPALPAGRFDLKYLEGPGGKAVYVPDKASLEEYLEWKAQQLVRAGKAPPGATVTSLLFTGT